MAVRKGEAMLKKVFSTLTGLATTVLFIALLAGTRGMAAEPAPILVFDQGHGQQFLAEKEGDLDLSKLAGVFKGQGFTVKTTNEKLSVERLRGVDALVISGPFAPLGQEENAAVLDFVARGGRVGIMLHIPFPLESLLKTLGVAFSNGVIQEQENTIDGKALDFRVRKLEPHPLFTAISNFSAFGCWALANIAPTAKILAQTGSKAWVDLNKDGQLSEGDAQQSLGVVVAGKLGKGEFVVFGDDAIFQNRFLGPENSVLAANFGRWLKKD